MTIEQELERFYGDLRPDPDAERRVIAAVTANSTVRAPRWRPVLAVALSAAAITLAAVLVVALRPESRSHSPQKVTHGGPPATKVLVPLVLPRARAGSVVGAVTDNGRPVSGARVYVQIFPSQEVEDRLKDGEAAPLLNAGDATTGADGGFSIAIPAKAFTRAWLTGGANGFFNVDYELDLPGRGVASMSAPINLRAGHTQPMRLIFDVGRMTVRVNGETSTLHWTDQVQTASAEPTR